MAASTTGSAVVFAVPELLAMIIDKVVADQDFRSCGQVNRFWREVTRGVQEVRQRRVLDVYKRARELLRITTNLVLVGEAALWWLLHTENRPLLWVPRMLEFRDYRTPTYESPDAAAAGRRITEFGMEMFPPGWERFRSQRRSGALFHVFVFGPHPGMVVVCPRLPNNFSSVHIAVDKSWISAGRLGYTSLEPESKPIRTPSFTHTGTAVVEIYGVTFYQEAIAAEVARWRARGFKVLADTHDNNQSDNES